MPLMKPSNILAAIAAVVVGGAMLLSMGPFIVVPVVLAVGFLVESIPRNTRVAIFVVGVALLIVFGGLPES